MTDDLKSLLDFLESLNPERVQEFSDAIEILSERMRILGDIDPKDITKEKLEAQKRLLEEREEILLRLLVLGEREAEALQNKITDGELLGTLSERQIKLEEIKLQRLRENLEAVEKQGEQGLVVTNIAKEFSNTLKETLDINEQIGESAARFIGSLTGIDDSWKNTLVGGFAAAAMKSQDLVGAMEQVGEKISEQLSPANILGSTYMKVMEIMGAWAMMTLDFAEAQDQMITSVREATFGSKEFDDVVVNAQLNVRTLGVDAKEMGAAFAALHRNMSEFTNMNKEAQMELLEFTAVMSEFGLSADLTATNLQILTKSLGFSVTAAQEVNRELIAAGQAIGMNADQIIAGFGQAMPVLAKYGKDAPEIFKRVAAASKATGISIQGLISITEGMDTFEGAGEAAGRLNALLGGTVNALDLLNATEEERIGILIRSVEQSGKSWESMGRFERQAIASAAGITNMAEANMLFGMSSSAYDEMIAKTQETALSQEELEAATRAQMSLTEKLDTLYKSFAVSLRPVFEGIGIVLDFVLKLRKEMGMGFNIVLLGTLGLLGGIALTIGAVVATLVAFKVAVALASAAQFFMTLQTNGLSAALASVGVSGPAAGAGASAAAAGVGALGAASNAGLGSVQLIAAAVAALGISFIAGVAAFALVIIYLPQIIEGFKELVPFMFMLPFYAFSAAVAINILAVGLSVFSTIMAIMAPIMLVAGMGLQALGAGALFLGVGVFTLGKGFEVFLGQVNKLPKAVETLFSLTFQLSSLLLIGATLAPSMVLLGLALLPLGIGIAALGAGLAAINDNVRAIGKLVEELDNLKFQITGLMMVGTTLAPAMFVLGVAMAPLGLSLALMGGGLLALGFGLDKIKKEADGLATLGLSLSLLAIPLSLLGALAGGGLLVIGAAFIAMGLGLLSIGAGLQSINKAMAGLKDDTTKRLGSFLYDLGWALASMAGPGALAGVGILIGASLGLPPLIEAAVKLTPQKVEAVGQVVKHASEYATVQRNTPNTQEGALSSLLKEIVGMKGGGGGAAGGAGSKTIVLKIGEREFARAVVNALEDYNELDI